MDFHRIAQIRHGLDCRFTPGGPDVGVLSWRHRRGRATWHDQFWKAMPSSTVNDLQVARHLMAAAPDRFRTLIATHRLWRDLEAERARSQAQSEQARLPQAARRELPWGPPRLHGLLDWSGTRESRRHLLVQPPDRVRLEDDRSLLVADQGHWWQLRREGRWPAMHGEGQQTVTGKLELEGVAFLLAPSWFSTRPDLAFAGRDRCSGRESLRVRSSPSTTAQVFPGVGWGSFSPEYELWIDAERGVLLRAIQRWQGRDFQIAELLDPTFDIELAKDAFAVRSDEGRQFMSWDDAFPAPLMSLEDVRARAEFPVYAPAELPPEAGTLQHASLIVPTRNVGLAWRDREGIWQVRLMQEGEGFEEGEIDPAAYEVIEREGRQMFVFEGPDAAWHSVTIQQPEARISVSSRLGREATIRLGLALQTG